MTTNDTLITPEQMNELEYIKEYEKTPQQQRFPISTTFELIKKASEDFPQDTALIQLITAEIGEQAEELSFQQLFQKVTQTANLLHSLAIKKNDVVSILLPNLVENKLAIWGSQVHGIANPINSFLNVEHIIEIMNEVQTKALFTLAPSASPELWDKVCEITKHVPSLKSIILVGAVAAENEADEQACSALVAENINVVDFYAELTKQEKGSLLGEMPVGDDIAMYFHTGGTTGRPKVARLTHSGISYICQVYCDFNQHLGRSPSLNALPLFHVFGVIAAGLGVLVQGRAVVMMTGSGFRHPNVVKNWWHFVEHFKAVTIPTVPTIMTALINQKTDQYDLSCLKYVGSGSAPLPIELKRAFEKKFQCEVSNGYGMTELSGLATRIINGFDVPENTVGNSLPYTSLIVAEVEGDKITKVCRTGEAGVILVKGPHVFKGYLNPKDNINCMVETEWFNTGDIGVIDDKGHVMLTGRAKDLIIRGGHNIDPLLIEGTLMEHEAVEQVTAIGQPDSYAGEVPVAYVVLKPGQTADEEQLIEYCKDNISERAAIPKRIDIIDALPVTAVGKIFKPELRNRATEYVVNDMLSEQNISLTIDATFDATKGQIITIHNAQENEQTQIVDLLKGLPVKVEFIN